MQIKVTIKNVYGVKTVYPACEQSRLLAQLAGTTTLTQRSVDIIKKLGYKILVQQEESKL